MSRPGRSGCCLISRGGVEFHVLNKTYVCFRKGYSMLEEGAVAPDFTAPDQGGKQVSLSDFRGKEVILYFYPKDDTPGCTKQACSFRDAFPKIKRRGITVLGVSPDSVKSHHKFAAKYELPYTLLSDPDHALSELYGVYQEKSFMGRKYMGVVRTTFLIDKHGRIKSIFHKVKPEGHALLTLDSF